MAIALALAGCSTPGELKTEQAGVKLTSSKGTNAVVTCLIDGFELLIKTAAVGSKPTPTGYTVYISMGVAMGRDTAMLVDVENTSSGSTSTYYSKVLVGEGKLVQVITGCQK